MSSTLERFESQRRRDPMAIERVLAFARARQAEGATDVVLTHHYHELRIDRMTAPHFAREAVARDPSLAIVLKVQPYRKRVMKRTGPDPGTGPKAMRPLGPWISALNISTTNNNPGRLANDAEDAAADPKINYEDYERKVLTHIRNCEQMLAEYKRIMTDPAYRREVAGR